MPSATTSRILASLNSNEILSSSVLVQRLCDSGMTKVSARKALERCSKQPEFWRSERLKLSGNERLFSRSEFVKSPDFVSQIKEALRQNNRMGLVRCLGVLASRGTLNWVDAIKLLAVSISNGAADRSRRPDFAEELDALRELGVEVVHEGIPNWRSLVIPWTRDGDVVHEAVVSNLKRLQVDAMICRVLCKSLAQHNLLGWNQVELPTEESPYVQFNRQIFSAFAFSYLGPLTRAIAR